MARLGQILIALAVGFVAAFGMAIIVPVVIGVVSLSPDYFYLRENTDAGLFSQIQPGNLILILLSPLTGIIVFIAVLRLRR